MEKPTTEPRVEYARRIEARLAEAASRMKRFRQVGVVRLGMLAALLLLIWFVINGLSFWWLLLPVFGYLGLAPTQQRIAEQRRRCERAAALYQLGLERLDDRWAGKGANGDRFLTDSHPYAATWTYLAPAHFLNCSPALAHKSGKRRWPSGC